MGLKSAGGGEIIQVQGGHIIRAMGRKDGHSKVFTAKGPRDRRVRLSAHTAIQFYDVQDRLGFDRPSKAVDWLMNKAKASIDKLAELPPWDPNVGGSTEVPVPDHTGSHYTQMHNENKNENESSFENNYPVGLSRQDLCLSLHHTVQDDPGSGPHSLGFDAGWVQHQDMGRFTRMISWAGGGGGGGGGDETRGGFMFNNPPLSFPQQGYSQKGTPQSSFSPFLGPGIGSGTEGFMGFCNPSHIQAELHGQGSVTNTASSSSLSPDGSSQH